MFSTDWLLENLEPQGHKLRRVSTPFQSGVCKVNGLLNKLSIVPPPGLFLFIYLFFFFPPSHLRHYSTMGNLPLFLYSTLSNVRFHNWSHLIPFQSTPTAVRRQQGVGGGGGRLRPGNLVKRWRRIMIDCEVARWLMSGDEEPYILLSHSNIYTALGLSA